MGFVDRARDDAVVRLRTELRMAAVRIVADISEEFRPARPRREDERPSRDRDEDLSRALLLDLAALLECLLVKYADHVSRPLVDDDLFLAELLPGRRHAIPALELRERAPEDAAEQVAERIADVRLGRRFGSAALRAQGIGRRRIRPAVDALVAEPLRDVDGRFFGIDEIPFRARKPVLLLQDLVALFDFDEGPFRILRIVHDSDLFRHRRQMEGEGLGDHRLARAGRADQQEVPPLIRRDPGERDRLVLADDTLQRIVRDRDLRGRLKVVEGEPLIRGDHLRSRDRLHPGYGARSLRVQTSMPAGCFVIVPCFVPATECLFTPAAMSRIRWVMTPSKTPARVCFAVLSVSTSSRTGTSVTTPSPSSRRRAVEDPPSWTSMSRYFSNFGLRTFVVGVSGAEARSAGTSRGSRNSGRGSGRGSDRGSGRPCGPPDGFGSGNSDSALYTWPEMPYISTYWSAGILFRRLFMICFCVSSSTSLPRGARAMKSTSATWRSSFRIRSPPRSPSTNAVSARSFDSSWIVLGTFVPSTAIAFLMPDRRRFRTSCRPSTMMIASLSVTFGPAGSRSAPNETISDTWTLWRTSSSRSDPEVFDSSTMDESREGARSMILFRFVTRVSSTLSTLIVALHGPTLSIVSRAAAKIEVSTWSSEEGIRIVPSLRPFLLCTSTSIRPMRPLFCKSLRSSSSPSSPSVC